MNAPAQVISAINARHRTRFALVGRFPDGESGAFELRDTFGTRFVLKWSEDSGKVARLSEVAAILDRLRVVGYPVPRVLIVGASELGCYAIQEFLPGQPLDRPVPALLPRILALNHKQAGMAAEPEDEWRLRLMRDAVHGGDGYCLVEPMRTYSSETGRLLTSIQRYITEHINLCVRCDDIVHFDFNPANILAKGGEISGVIDWDGVCAGDRSFGLATLLFYWYDDLTVRDRIWIEATAIAAPAAMAVYLAHMIHRQIDWSIRHHDKQTVDGWLEHAGMIGRYVYARIGTPLNETGR